MALDYGRPQPLAVKQLGPDQWEVSGYLSTYGNEDDGGDVVLPGAFDAALASGRKVKFLFNHDGSKVLGPPLHLQSDSRGLYATAKISKTALGTDIHTLLLDGALDSWSMGYLPTETELQDQGNGHLVRHLKSVELFEGSLVAVPMNTQALVTGVKAHEAEAKTAKPVHHTATDTGAWDGPAAEARLKPDDEASWWAAAAWYDSSAPDPNGDGLPDRKGDYAFWHHEVDAQGKVGAANVTACSTGVGILNGGRGANADARWWGQRGGIHAHLAAHLKDAGQEAPPLKAGPARDEKTLVAMDGMANHHVCRLVDPGDLQPGSIRTMTRDHQGQSYDVLVGKRKGDTSMSEVSYHYPTADWTAAQARAHCQSHQGEAFGAATGGKALDACSIPNPDPEFDAKAHAHEQAIASAAESTVPWQDAVDDVLTALESGEVKTVGLLTRFRVHADLRAKEGRPINAARRQRLAEVRQQAQAVIDALDQLLSETEPPVKGYLPTLDAFRLELQLAGLWTPEGSLDASH